MSHLLNSPSFQGTPTAPTPTVGDDSNRLATTAYILDSFVSPAFSGVPTAPTALTDTNTTQIATTAFVQNSKTYSLRSVFQSGLAGTIAAWYAASAEAGAAITTLALTANRLYALPFYAPRQLIIDRLAFNVSTAGSGNARIGIYQSSNGIDLSPTSLIYDSGSLSITTTGIKNGSTALSITLDPGLYWFVLHASSTVTVRAFAAADGASIFGYSNLLTGAAQVGLYGTLTYGTLPVTFPTGATALNTAFPGIFARFSG